ncbi:MAG TPA: hypothetical protein VGT41_03665 [Candidatus Babeliales bacterium]|nr:hypothetical protein [Candidatus Babeliales bacterium]
MILKRLSIFAIVLLCGTQPVNAVNVNIYSVLPFAMYARWLFAGDYFRRDIPAATPYASGMIIPTFYPDYVRSLALKYLMVFGWMGVSDWRLHTGFTDVHTVGAKVGQVWGRDPVTWLPLVFTTDMLNAYGQCWGINNDFYSAPLGQAVYSHFLLSVTPVKNTDPKYKDAAGNSPWWPSFRITRLDPSVSDQIINGLASAGGALQILTPDSWGITAPIL